MKQLMVQAALNLEKAMTYLMKFLKQWVTKKTLNT